MKNEFNPVYNYEKCCLLNDSFYHWMLKKELKVDITYYVGYYNYFKQSTLGEPSLFFKNSKFKNHNFSFHSYMVEREKCPFYLSCWYYLGGDNGHFNLHLDFDIDNFATLDELFEWALHEISDFYNLNLFRPKQLSIFDFI